MQSFAVSRACARTIPQNNVAMNYLAGVVLTLALMLAQTISVAARGTSDSFADLAQDF